MSQTRWQQPDAIGDATRSCGNCKMIGNDKELEVTQERIHHFQSILLQLRVSASLQEYPYVASGYIAEIDKMQAEVMGYLKRHSSEPLSSVSLVR